MAIPLFVTIPQYVWSYSILQVFGGIAGYFLLGETNENASSYRGNGTDNLNDTTESFAFCGSNDCQIDSKLNEIITNYTPTNRYKFIIMITIFVAMSICSLIFYACILPNPLKKSQNKRAQALDTNCHLETPDITGMQGGTQDDNVSLQFIERPADKQVSY